MSKLICENLSVKYFGYDTAISDVTTTFHDGINVLFAQEKGGKTTLLKAIAGIVPYFGLITLDGVSLSELSIKERDFQMLFDDYGLFTRRSARYNLEYPLRIRKVPKAERKRMVEEVAALFDLDIMLDAPVYRLNEWLKVALVLCRAYLRRPKVLLIDNIFSKLDLVSRKEAFLRFLPMFQDGIVIYATDSVEEAASLSKEIKFLSYGYLIQEGSPFDFKTAPQSVSAFCAFQEYSTVLPAVAFINGLSVGGKEFAVSVKFKNDIYLGKTVLAGFAPTQFALSEDGFAAVIKMKFYFGERALFSATTEAGDVFFYCDKDLSVGETVNLSITGVAGVFDALNERNVTEVAE